MRLPAVCLLVTLSAAVFAQDIAIPTLDMDKGAEGWSAWTGTVAHEWVIEPSGGHDGKPVLRIDAVDRAAQVMVMTNSDLLEPDKRYEFTVWWRFDNLSRSHAVDLRIIYRDADGKWITGDDLYPHATDVEGDWTRKRYRTVAPARTASAAIGIWVRDTTGTIYVSDMSCRELEPGKRGFDSMYVYDPYQVLLGSAPLNGFHALQEANSPFLPRADRWNHLMVRVGFLQEDLARARRAWDYATPRSGFAVGLEADTDGILESLDSLQQTYGRLYDAGDADALPEQFDAPAKALEARVTEVSDAVRAFTARMRGMVGEADWVRIPRADTDAPWWDAETAQPRYIFWNRWSGNEWRQMEEPLNLGDGQTLTAGAPRFDAEGNPDWSTYTDQWDKASAAGATRSSLITHYSLHDKGYLSPTFLKAHENDDDIVMFDAEGKPTEKSGGLSLINWLDPKVRAHMVDMLTRMAEFFKDQTQYQFYVTSWESAGPYAGGVRIGGNPSHTTAFREYLEERYGDIATLNRRWGTQYGGFDELSPSPEQTAAVDAPRSPLYLESQRWAHEAYIDYLRLIRDTLHSVDPSKPVLGEQSGLLSRVLSPRIYESVDILGHHNRARTTMPVEVWMHSLGRYSGKPTALYENFWGCQEDHPQRMHDEKVMRAQLRRYLYRHAAWGRCTQTWWYAYTSAPYLTSYNGNWFTPIYDLTTLRYSAAGLPVEKEKVDRLEALLLDSDVVASRLLVVQPYAAMLAQNSGGPTYQEWLAWHDVLYPANQLYEMLPDSWFAEGTCSLDDFDAVVLPIATHLDRGFSLQLVQWLRRGGVCIASGPAGVYDELGLPDGAILAAAGLPTSATKENADAAPWRLSYGATPGEQGWVEVAVGEGKLILLPQSISTRDDWVEPLRGIIRNAAPPAAEAPDTTLELLLRRLPDGTHLLCALNTSPDDETRGDVLLRGEFARAADIDIDPPVAIRTEVLAGATRLRLWLPPGGSTYVLLSR